MMKTFFNGTPHPINVVANGVSSPAIRKFVVPEGMAPEITISIPSDGMLNAKIESVQADSINGVPTFGKKVIGCDPIPEGDIIIVSALYVSAARAMGLDTARLYTVADPVYSPDGKTILGCRGICLAF